MYHKCPRKTFGGWGTKDLSRFDTETLQSERAIQRKSFLRSLSLFLSKVKERISTVNILLRHPNSNKGLNLGETRVTSEDWVASPRVWVKTENFECLKRPKTTHHSPLSFKVFYVRTSKTSTGQKENRFTPRNLRRERKARILVW